MKCLHLYKKKYELDFVFLRVWDSIQICCMNNTGKTAHFCDILGAVQGLFKIILVLFREAVLIIIPQYGEDTHLV